MARALHRAAARGNVDRVHEALGFGVAVDARDEQQRTPLLAAVAGGHQSTASALLDAGADVNATDEDGNTALATAALNRHEGLIPLLLAAGANPDLANAAGCTPLFCAAGRCSAAAVHALLAAGAQPGAENLQLQTPLHHACQEGRSEAASLLLDAEVDIDAATQDGATPLALAACNGRAGVIELLLARGSAVDHPDLEGTTPLMFACAEAHEGAARLLLQAGAAVNAADSRGRTPLIHAAIKGSPAIVAALLGAGADVNVADERGDTALLFAGANGHPRLIQPLLAAGASANAADSHTVLAAARFCSWAPSQCPGRGQHDPLYMCLIGEHYGVARRLLAAGADPTLPTLRGEGPIHYAAQHGNAELLREMVAAATSTASLVARSGDLPGVPLHFATANDRLPAVQALLAVEPAAALVPDLDGKLPLEVALDERHMEVARCLLQQGQLPPTACPLVHAIEQAGEAAAPLFSVLVARMALPLDHWEAVSAGCPGLAAELPAVLARSEREAAQLVARLGSEKRQCLRAGALCLAWALKQAGASLPRELVWRVLAVALAE
ncbi:hypothetical protein ABPG75_011660 [Micractinium tetrahymenae]